ncbi:unnamed protein product, partial [Ectocarpus sp. 6 AP-2014]
VDEAPSLQILARYLRTQIWQHPCQPGEPQEPREGASVCCWVKSPPDQKCTTIEAPNL